MLLIVKILHGMQKRSVQHFYYFIYLFILCGLNSILPQFRAQRRVYTSFSCG